MGAIARAQRSAESQVNIDYGLHVIVTLVDEQVLKDVRYAMHHEGVSSFKMFMAYPGVMMADDAAIFRMLRQVGADGGMLALHAENGTWHHPLLALHNSDFWVVDRTGPQGEENGITFEA